MRRSLSAQRLGAAQIPAAWFEIGDHLGDVIFGLLQGRYGCPLPDEKWDYLYAGVDCFAPTLRERLAPLFPHDYSSPQNLAFQLQETYSALCRFADKRLRPEDQPKPSWDGSTLCWCGCAVTLKRQSNGVLVSLFDEAERLGWPQKIPLSSKVEGDVKQAVYNFNRRYRAMSLSFAGNHVAWFPNLPSSSD
jgi:hypothetical protein